MKFLWKLQGNSGCIGKRPWKNSNHTSSETTVVVPKMFFKNGFDSKFKMAVMPIYGKKTFKQLVLQNHWIDSTAVLQEAFWTLPNIE